jgi:signal transduction histidine kinase
VTGLIETAVGASSATVAAVATWAAQLPGRRRLAQRLKTARTRLREAEAAQRDTESRGSAESAEMDEICAQWERQLKQARDEAFANWQYAQLVIGEVEHFVEQRLPTVVQELRGVPVLHRPGLRHGSLEGSEIAGYLTALDTLLRKTASDVRRQAEESAGAGVRVAAEEIQAGLTRAQRDIDAALDADEDQGVSTGSTTSRALAKIDHAVTLANHTVQRLRILADSWPGVQRANCSILEIIESARGHIHHFDAVEYTFQAETADVLVEGLVVEPVIVALAELLDNATAYSGEKAATYVQRVRTGIRITVEDSGLGMSPLQLERAEHALASGGADVTALAEPFSLGFLVIGRLIHQYNLRVALSPSASGGVRADLLIPEERLVTEADTDHPAPRAESAQPAAQLRPIPLQVASASDTETIPVPPWFGWHERATPEPAPDAPAVLAATAATSATSATSEHSAPAVSTEHSATAMPPEHTTPAVPPSHSTPAVPPEHSATAMPPGHTTPAVPPEHRTPAVSPEHSTPPVPPGHTTPAITPSRSTPPVPPGHRSPPIPPSQAAAGASSARAHALPKRQPRRARPQGTAPRQHALSEPEAEALTKGFEQLSHILAEEFGTENTTEGRLPE